MRGNFKLAKCIYSLYRPTKCLEKIKLHLDGLPQINNTPHIGPEPHGSARVSLILPNEDGVRDRQQPHQRAMLQELEDLWFICETPTKRQNRNISATSHRHLQNCCNIKYHCKGATVTRSLCVLSSTNSLSTEKKMGMDQTNKKPDKPDNISSAEAVRLSIIFHKKIDMSKSDLLTWFPLQALQTSQSSLHPAEPFLSLSVSLSTKHLLVNADLLHLRDQHL